MRSCASSPRKCPPSSAHPSSSTIAAAPASDCPNEVALHARGALNRGAKREEIIETILQCAPYVGFPKTNHALKAAKDVFDRWETKKDDWKAL
ncbi:MAG: carboxymuconolactone decarboxylase family protein [Alphaproteobacteria bacterium]|nr:MAG: carboxymuconolactone decarboxylase family protein [Alphaproteobacteria bacterium]